MSHRFYDGQIYHKRLNPTKHDFTYKFFMVDIEISTIEKLKNKLFSLNRFNLFSFYSKDHFGNSKNFNENIENLLKKFSIDTKDKNYKIRFITLPRICGFVFNPISLLILLENDRPKYLLAEVHNYNGGRIIYPLKLETKDGKKYFADGTKDMYVSPFFKRDGEYKFTLKYTKKELVLNILLYEDKEKMLTTTLNTKAMQFNTRNILKLFLRHTFLTFFVVTRTIYQSIKLKLKGLKWTSPIKQDQIRRY
ncbi:DUF1365 domain-containing protein [Campylobacterota bacterium DY0563]